MGQLYSSVKDSALSRQVRSDSFNKNMGNDLSCLKCEGERKETDPPLGKYMYCVFSTGDFLHKLACINSIISKINMGSVRYLKVP